MVDASHDGDCSTGLGAGEGRLMREIRIERECELYRLYLVIDDSKRFDDG